MRRILLTLVACVGLLNAFSQGKDNKQNTFVTISTSYGDIKIKLYDETPKHRDNFIKLAKEGYLNNTLFHRVIKDFMIQGGDPDSKTSAPGAMLGNGGPGYTIPAEFNDSLYHKKGALAAARTGDQMNPMRESSGSQFYIVQGRPFTESDLKRFETNINQERMNMLFTNLLSKPENAELKKMIDGFVKVGNQNELNFIMQQVQPQMEQQLEQAGKYKYSAQAIREYATIGGAPHLDGLYTVFGEVVEGLDVIDKIAALPVGPNDRPVQDIAIQVKISRK
ncbi:MAG: peptidylprolyl isomerase [Bacteroidota bacterium]